MKLASFILNGTVKVGIVNGDTISIVDVPDMVTLIENWDKDRAASATSEVKRTAVDLLAPIPVPRRNIICVGKNYRDHAKEFSQSGFEAGAVKGKEIDEFPAVFTKMPSSVTCDGAVIELPHQVSSSVDYEAELAVVIGKKGKNIAASDALGHVFGYTIINDLTARDRQKNHKQWFLGKTLDGFCPMGPWITTADEVDVTNLDVQCWVNGEIRQNANTRDLIFDVKTLISTISAGTTLLPGDIIATGTPAGVGIGFSPPKFLKAGDKVSVRISGLGELSNSFA